ncbi:DUF1275 domain-containing protein [Mycobacterium sp. 21AC1]|uniref:YoaK family protein n=1 Tax=[Mycobacterium] appelbergii TaxID=2939269 RepID=UPI0029393ACE|nr:YoaK family protein [Mycobacterium sp. 21AC1]MDV3124136.1 DUF1275 domain-containing protein [Mycobacterium sp. 21AC1]
MSADPTPCARHHVSPAPVLLMLALTFSTGIVDAVGFLGLDQVFTGNMTGNIVILGMGVAGADGLPVVGPAVALAGFMIGAAFAGRMLKGGADTGWSTRIAALIALTAAIEIGTAGVFIARVSASQGAAGVLIAGCLGVAMGGQAAAARHVAVKDVTTVVVTSTLTGLAADATFGMGAQGGARRRLAAIVAILLGAVVGAALLKIHIGIGLMMAGLVTATVSVIGHAAYRGGRGF